MRNRGNGEEREKWGKSELWEIGKAKIRSLSIGSRADISHKRMT